MVKVGETQVLHSTLHNSMLHNGTLHNGTIHNGMLQNSMLQNECCYKTVHVTKQYVQKGTVAKR
jgi:hypothetical protein